MEENEHSDQESVTVSMELTGRYDDVVGKLETDDRKRADLREVAADFERILDTVDRIDGGTKSVIVENLPGDTSVDYDSDAVVNALQVLERYDLVTLEGNTWMVA